MPSFRSPMALRSTLTATVNSWRFWRTIELCGFTAKAGLYRDMFKGIRYVTDMTNISKMNPNKPVAFMSGSDDPVGDYGKGVRKAYACFQKAGVKDLGIKLYAGGRHEMLNEINRGEVYQDILQWLNQRM